MLIIKEPEGSLGRAWRRISAMFWGSPARVVPAVLLIAAGAVFSFGSLLAICEHIFRRPAVQHGHTYEFSQSTVYDWGPGTPTSCVDRSYHIPPRVYQPGEHSTVLVPSAAAIALGALLLLRRFSLRVLVVAVLSVGAAGAVPFARGSGGWPSTFGRFYISFPMSLDQARAADIETRLDPGVALATVPPGFLKEARLPAPGGNVPFTVWPYRGEAGGLEVRFDHGLTLEQRQAIASFYNAYFRRLFLEHAIAQGFPITGKEAEAASFGEIWPRWREKWEQQMATAPPQTGP
jgi:hypothetical protein